MDQDGPRWTKMDQDPTRTSTKHPPHRPLSALFSKGFLLEFLELECLLASQMEPNTLAVLGQHAAAAKIGKRITMINSEVGNQLLALWQSNMAGGETHYKLAFQHLFQWENHLHMGAHVIMCFQSRRHFIPHSADPWSNTSKFPDTAPHSGRTGPRGVLTSGGFKKVWNQLPHPDCTKKRCVSQNYPLHRFTSLRGIKLFHCNMLQQSATPYTKYKVITSPVELLRFRQSAESSESSSRSMKVLRTTVLMPCGWAQQLNSRKAKRGAASATKLGVEVPPLAWR